MLIYEDIALISGYDTQRSFSKSFKALFKMSPSSYRKQQKLLLVQLKLGLRQLGSNYLTDEHCTGGPMFFFF